MLKRLADDQRVPRVVLDQQHVHELSLCVVGH